MARALVIMGAEAQSVAVAWQVYLITHRAIDLGYTGLALFLPGLIFMLPAGHTADRFDRAGFVDAHRVYCLPFISCASWSRNSRVRSCPNSRRKM